MRLLRTALILHRQALLLATAVLLSLVLAEGDAGAFHDERGGHIDQVAIDMGPPGVAVDVEGNGKPAVGDRNLDGAPDAEGYDTPDPGDSPGVCGNGIDDDQQDSDGDTAPGPGGFDGVADDGCQVTLTPLEQCAEIIDDGVINADEDSLVAGQDRLSIDVTVGAQPGPGGGIPADRRLKTSFLILKWDADVIDIDVLNPNFLISAAGSPHLLVISPPLPHLTSPFLAIVDDIGSTESGPGVIARLTIEGNGAGVANLVFVGGFDDFASVPITMDRILQARVAVSKDVNGDTVIAGAREVFRCCPVPAVAHVLARSRNQSACAPASP